MFQPLSFAFSMLEVGGSAVQSYSFIENEYFPDRGITPYKLIPHLEVSDPSGIISDGDISSHLSECRWLINGSTVPSDEDFHVDPDDHSLTIGKNVVVGQKIDVEFLGHYLDKRRGEVSEFKWHTMLTTHENVDYKISMEVDCPRKCLLNPLKLQHQQNINARLLNGGRTLTEDDCEFEWSFREPDMDDFQRLERVEQQGFHNNPCWYASGQETAHLVILPKFLDNTLLKLVAFHKNAPKQKQEWVARIRRHYGMYSEDIVFLEGKYIFPDTPRAVARAVVSNGRGEITNPSDFFDIEIFYSRGGSSAFHSVAYGEVAEVPRKDFGADLTAQHKFGVMVRERTALRPVTLNGCAIIVSGAVVTLNAPISSREV